ncbi:hypothetical protein JW948_09655 [bacterium]|nr:hypothetical protein [bacterium]
MHEDEIKALQEELEQFQCDKNKIRMIIGSIGGKTGEKQDKLFNVLFIVFIGLLFIMDIVIHLLDIELPVPPLFLIAIGLLLVSIKIVWMMNKQMKVEHFQFWILNSIEYRVNDISKKLVSLEKAMRENREK